MKKRLLFISALILVFNSVILAQGCGPNCPACSGTTDGNLISAKSLSLQGMYIPTGEEEFGIMSLKYGAFDWMDLGIAYTFKAEKIIWNARLQVIKQNEDNWKPNIILGTGSIRTGSSDQSIYVNVLKTKEFSENFAMSVSGGVASLASEIDKIYGIGNVSFIFMEKITTFVNFDGISFHEGIMWTVNDWFTAGFMMIESKDPAITVNFTKSLARNKTPEGLNNL
jgi:hypothetical protein